MSQVRFSLGEVREWGESKEPTEDVGDKEKIEKKSLRA